MFSRGLGLTCWLISLAPRNSSMGLPWCFQPICKPLLGTFWFCLCRCSEAASPRCMLYLPSLDSFVQIPGSAGLPVQCSDLPRLAPQTNNFGALSFCSLHLTFHLSCLWPRLSPYYVIVCTWGFQEGKNQEACEGSHCANPFQMVMRNGR